MGYKTMDANEAVSRVSYKFTEIAGIYPITPASPMAEKVDVLASKGEINFWGNKVKVIEMESEKGAIATVHGALQAGVLATTYTASQGLLLMIPSIYKMAGEMLPGVIHVRIVLVFLVIIKIYMQLDKLVLVCFHLLQ